MSVGFRGKSVGFPVFVALGFGYGRWGTPGDFFRWLRCLLSILALFRWVLPFSAVDVLGHAEDGRFASRPHNTKPGAPETALVPGPLFFSFFFVSDFSLRHTFKSEIRRRTQRACFRCQLQLLLWCFFLFVFLFPFVIFASQVCVVSLSSCFKRLTWQKKEGALIWAILNPEVSEQG